MSALTALARGGARERLGVTAEGPTFDFYRDSYGGTLSPEELSECMPAALRAVRLACGGAGPRDCWPDGAVEAWGRAACAALAELAGTGLAFSGAGRP